MKENIPDPTKKNYGPLPSTGVPVQVQCERADGWIFSAANSWNGSWAWFSLDGTDRFLFTRAFQSVRVFVLPRAPLRQTPDAALLSRRSEAETGDVLP
jgi:hypothetical protein